MKHSELILILDFGSQYTQLIARRIRESRVYSEIHPYNIDISKIKSLNPKAIILSGGPMSVYDKDAPQIESEIFNLKVPLLGICYGMQILAKHFGGEVKPAAEREYGKTTVKFNTESPLFQDLSFGSSVWMSHGDYITYPPKDFEVIASSDNSPISGLENKSAKIYGVQFHPEVAHTTEGEKVINNFLFNICECKGDWTPGHFITNSICDIKLKVENKKVICALSGGVDSSVAAILVHKAIGEQLHLIHVDTGLMRKGESASVVKMFKENYDISIDFVNAENLFLSRLKNISDPEQKRKIIGNTFIEVFEEEAKKFKDADFLVQGTLYPDVIESVQVKGISVTIKTHHNVGGLPEKMNLKLIEPFRELFKDEVRAIGKELGIPEDFLNRHPFPGPGLAVRILGDVTKEKLDILREVDDIFIKEIKSAGVYDEIWQAFAVFLPVQSVGVMGDYRTYENVVALRAVTSSDAMTADWYRFDYELLDKISNKIIRNVKGVNRIVYDISSKPPSTIEWE